MRQASIFDQHKEKIKTETLIELCVQYEEVNTSGNIPLLKFLLPQSSFICFSL